MYTHQRGWLLITITNRTNMELYKSEGGDMGKHFTEVPIKVIVITVVLKSPGVYKTSTRMYTQQEACYLQQGMSTCIHIMHTCTVQYMYQSSAGYHAYLCKCTKQLGHRSSRTAMIVHGKLVVWLHTHTTRQGEERKWSWKEAVRHKACWSIHSH